MAKNSYAFAELITFTGASRSEVTHWSQSKLIRPDVEDSGGTGEPRRFGFLDLVEGGVVRRLNQLPGGCPIVHMAHALEVLRFEAALPGGSPWRRFLLRETREADARVWLHRAYGNDAATSSVWRVATSAEQLLSFITAATDAALVVLPLHTIVTELEQATDDHASADECDDAWMKEKPRPRRRQSARVQSADGQRTRV
jgi:hypothetical protein